MKSPHVDERFVGPLVFGIAALVLTQTSLPGVHWHDTGEFPAVAWWLSTAHPPGLPLHALSTHGLLRVPVGDLGLRANWVSAWTLAAALAIFARALCTWVRPSLALWAGVLPVLMPAVWLQGVRSEVYALHLLLTAALALLVVRTRPGDLRPAIAVAFVLGLSGANHTLLAAATAPLPLALLWTQRRSPGLGRGIAGAAAAVALGLATYAYLPLRAEAGLDVGWGQANSLAAFIDTVLARDWHRNLAAPASAGLDLVENGLQMVEWGLDQVGPGAALLLLLIVLTGLPFAARPLGGPALAAAALGLATVLTRFFYPFDPWNPDIGGYFAPALLAGLGITTLCAESLARQGRRAHGLVLGALLVVLGLAGGVFDTGGRTVSRTAERVARAAWDEVPPAGVWVVADYATWFQGFWLRALYGERPDLAVLFRGRVDAPWHTARVLRRRPDLEPRLGAFPDAFSGDEVRFERGVEAGRLGAFGDSLRPDGLGLSHRSRPRAERAADEVASPDDLDSRVTLCFRRALAAAEPVRRGDDGAGDRRRAHLEAARALCPFEDAWLTELSAAGSTR
jgi:hypothetical protein